MKKLKSLYKFFSPKYQTVFLEYKVDVKPRFGHGLPPNSALYEIINSNRNIYKEHLQFFTQFISVFQSIKDISHETNEDKPSWNNGHLPGLDIVGIYGMLAKYKPLHYVEIGSGNSTKVARKSIVENHLNTQITSIDPYPRAIIDHLADKVIREPLENLTNVESIAAMLNENDILFIDNSHRCFPNSDVTVCFLELLPKLKKGVIVHVHDIYLPYDYPQFMCERFYNEQYVLAAFILANPEKYKTILPNYFISEDKELSSIVEPIWNYPGLSDVERHGGSFWFRIQ